MEKSKDKKIEEELRIKNNAIKSSINAIALADLEGNLTYVNPSFLKIWGYSEEKEVIGKSSIDFWQMEDKATNIIKYLYKIGNWRGELIAKRKNGSFFDALLSASMILDSSGKPIHMMASFIDITEQKKMEDNLLKTISELNQIFNASIPMCMTDLNYNIIKVNNQFKNFFQLNESELIQKKCFDVYQSPLCNKAECSLKQILSGKEKVRNETIIENKNGKIMYCIIENYPYWDEKGKIIGIIKCFTDITERVLNEKRIRESEEKWRSLGENAPSIIMTVERDGTISFINHTVPGLSVEEVIGKNVKDYISHEHIEIGMNAIEKVFQTGEAEIYQVSGTGPYGNVAWYRTKVGPIVIEGKVIAVIQIITDITEYKKTEEKLKKSERRFRTIIENTSDAIVITGFNGKNIYLSPQAHKIIGYEDLSPEFDIFRYIHPDDSKHLIKLYSEVIKKKSVPERKFEFRALHKDGHYIWLSSSSKEYYDDDGNRIGFISSLRDVTERKTAEKRLKESEEKYRLISEKANDLISVLDQKMKYEYINERAHLNILGYLKEDIIGKSVIKMIHPNDIKIAIEGYKNGFETGKGLEEVRIRHKNGEYIWLEIRGETFIDSDGLKKALLISRDITERKRTHQKLIESEQKYRDLFENSPLSVGIMDVNGIFLDCNQAAEKLFGYQREEIIGNHFQKIAKYPAESLSLIMDNYKTLLKGKVPKPLEVKLNKKSGPIHVMIHSNIIPTEFEPFFQFIIQDISDIKKAEKELKESEERLKILFEYAPDAYYINDLKGKFIDGNKAAESLIGYKKEELIGKDFLKLKILPKDQIQKAADLLSKNIKGISTGPDELVLLNKEGVRIPLEIRTFPVKIKDEPLVLGIARDITERKKTIQKLRESEEKWHSLTENSFDTILIADKNDVIQYINTTIHPQTTEEVIGTSIYEYISKEHHDVMRQSLKKVYKTGKPDSFEFSLDMEKSTSEMDILWYNTKIVPIKTHKEVSSVIMIVTDITERRMAEQRFKEKLEKEVQLRTRELNEALEQHKYYLDQILKSSQFKTEFLATMSHELRTPLNAIIGFTDLLLEGSYGDLNKNQRDFLNDIKNSAIDQFEMVKNILDISKIESGILVLNKKKFSLNNIVEQVQTTLKHEYSKKGLIFKIEGLDSEKEIYADLIRFKEILFNLISNAIKYTIEGQITLKIQEQSDQWLFKVRDTGIGIARKDYTLIFKEFRRVNSSHVNSIPGSGLGLSLTKRLVELHRGEISFFSVEGEGTTFTFSIPKE